MVDCCFYFVFFDVFVGYDGEVEVFVVFEILFGV